MTLCRFGRFQLAGFLLFLVSFFGQGLAHASEVNMSVEIRTISNKELQEAREWGEKHPSPKSITSGTGKLAIGESKEQTDTHAAGSEIESVQKKKVTALSLESVLESDPGWSIPTYLAPNPSARALLYTTEGTYTVSKRSFAWKMLSVRYDVNVDSKAYHIQYITSKTETVSEPKPSIYTVFPDRDMPRTETVLVNGRQADALFADDRWQLHASYPKGNVSLFSDLPLDELVKVMESLPQLQN